MEIVGSTSIADIFSNNDNWDNFVAKFSRRIRDAVFKCQCGQRKDVFFTCKSRFCSTCGALQTNKWIATYETNFLDIPYQHIVFTLPDCLWPIIQIHRGLDSISLCGPPKTGRAN